MSKPIDKLRNLFSKLKNLLINKKEEANEPASSFDEKIKKWQPEEKEKKILEKKNRKHKKKEAREVKRAEKKSKITDVIIDDDAISPDLIEKEEKKQGKTIKAFKTVGKSILVLFVGLLIGVGGFIAYAFLINPFTAFDASGFKKSDPSAVVRYNNEINISKTEQTGELDRLLSLADQEIMEGIINVAVIGVDYEPIRETSSWKTKDKQFFADVMLVLAINFNENTVDMINIPRDTYWGIYQTPGYYKLNMSFYAGGEFEGDGFYYTTKSMENVLAGIPIDYYIGVTMPVVKEIVDVLGGVDFEIEQKMVMSDRVLYPGMQHLDGQQVLDFLRVRQKRNPGLGNDIARVDRQKEMLIALFTQAKKSNKLLSIPKIISAMEGRVYTNLTYQQLSSLVIFGTGINQKNIGMYTFTGTYNYTMANHHLYILNSSKRIEIIKEVYGIMVEPSKTYNKTKFSKDALVIKSAKLAAYAQKKANAGTYGSAGTSVLKAASRLKTAIKEGDSDDINYRYNVLVNMVGDSAVKLYFSDFNKDGMPYHG